MNKILIRLLIALIVCYVSVTPLPIFNTASAQQKPIPPYAKWGNLAVRKTHEKYPNAQIIDYLHIGRTSGPHLSVEKFKLWLRENNKEFGVFINIEFDNITEKVMKITFRETSK